MNMGSTNVKNDVIEKDLLAGKCHLSRNLRVPTKGVLPTSGLGMEPRPAPLSPSSSGSELRPVGLPAGSIGSSDVPLDGGGFF